MYKLKIIFSSFLVSFTFIYLLSLVISKHFLYLQNTSIFKNYLANQDHWNNSFEIKVYPNLKKIFSTKFHSPKYFIKKDNNYYLISKDSKVILKYNKIHSNLNLPLVSLNKNLVLENANKQVLINIPYITELVNKIESSVRPLNISTIKIDDIFHIDLNLEGSSSLFKLSHDTLSHNLKRLKKYNDKSRIQNFNRAVVDLRYSDRAIIHEF